jgi:hypothetical protein
MGAIFIDRRHTLADENLLHVAHRSSMALPLYREDFKMATRVKMKHKDTGLTKDGFVGYSWTTLFWGFWPALFRGDYATAVMMFLVLVLVGAATAGIGSIIAAAIWGGVYNKSYTQKLIENGYEFYDSETNNALAAAAVGQI